MSNDSTFIFQTLKSILTELNIHYSAVYLFGSRARGTANIDSDWDFIVVVNDALSDYDRRLLKAQVRMKFHDSLDASGIDIIIKSETTFSREKSQRNTISYDAAKYGVHV